MLLLGGKKVGRHADWVHKLANARDPDLDLLPRNECDVVGGHQARARQEDAPRGNGIVAHDPLGELRERAPHPRGRSSRFVDDVAVWIEQAELDFERP